MRAKNGSEKPFGVRLWGVGNENWGCGGNYDAPRYAREYVRYGTMLRHVDPKAELVVCGHDDAWNVQLLETIGKHQLLIDRLSIHHYRTHGGPEIAFSEANITPCYRSGGIRGICSAHARNHSCCQWRNKAHRQQGNIIGLWSRPLKRCHCLNNPIAQGICMDALAFGNECL